jgi:hypothetical protein
MTPGSQASAQCAALSIVVKSLDGAKGTEAACFAVDEPTPPDAAVEIIVSANNRALNRIKCFSRIIKINNYNPTRE